MRHKMGTPSAPLEPELAHAELGEEGARQAHSLVAGGHPRAQTARTDRQMGPCLSPRHVSVSRSARAIVPRMVAISAIRETEAWSSASIGVGVVLLIVGVVLLVWQVRKFLNGPRP